MRVVAHGFLFCETDSAVPAEVIKIKPQVRQSPIHQPKPLRHPGQRSIHESIVLGFQSLKCAQVHSLGFAAAAVQDARLPSKPPPDGVSPPTGLVIIRFPLALVGQIVTVPAGEDCAAVENCHTPPVFSARMFLVVSLLPW